MAFPQVGSSNTSLTSTANTEHTVNLPSSISSGDLLLIFFCCDQTSGGISWGGDFVELSDMVAFGAIAGGIAYKIATGGEGATVTVTTVNSRKAAHQSYRITAASFSGNAPERAEGTHAQTQYPDPTTLTPTWGAKDTLWFAFVAIDGGRDPAGWPDNYPVGWQVFNDTTGGNDAGVAVCRRELNAASENPTTFDIGQPDDHICATLGVEPAAAYPTGPCRIIGT